VWKVLYNLYHCRLGDIPAVVCADDDEDDEYTDEDLETMKLRPGIERALDVEHRKALRRTTQELKKMKIKVRKGPGMTGETLAADRTSSSPNVFVGLAKGALNAALKS